MKNIAKAGMALGLFLGAALITYALTSFFTKEDFFLTPQKKPIFEIKVSGGDQPGFIGPGDSFSTSPTVYNNATEEMYVFIKVEMPVVSDGGLYEFVVGDGWVKVEDGVYAYGGDEMTTLAPGETTKPLTSEMTLRSMSNAEYSTLENISIKITGYAIGTEDVGSSPQEAWEVCKSIGNIE